MERQEFAALLAQVIPVLILALIVEFRAVGDYWLRVVDRLEAKAAASDPPDREITRARRDIRQNLWGQVLFTFVLLAYLIFELTALLAAAGVNTAADAAGPGVVPLLGIGFLLVIAMQALNMVWAFHRMGFIGRAYTAAVLSLLAVLLLLACWVIVVLAGTLPA